MGTDIVQAEYDELDTIAGRFKGQAEANADLYSRIESCFQALEKDWEGKGVDAFSAVMKGEMFPAIRRLTDALEEARSVTLEVKFIIQQAEEEAANPFRGDGQLLNLSGGGGGEQPFDLTNTSGSSEPSFDTVSNTEGITYQKVPGEPFLPGPVGENKIHPNDITQGLLADCYLIASLSAVAIQNSAVIEKMIKDNNGTYTVTFYEKSGNTFKPVEITINKEFPVNKANEPAFAKPGDVVGGKKELWGVIIEKAYAKWQGGYKNIEYKTSHEMMERITGKASTSITTSSLTLDKLAEYKANGNAITVSTYDDEKFKLFGWEIFDISDKTDSPHYTKQRGPLTPDHEYYITGVNKEKNEVILRNPWGWERGEIKMSFEDFKEGFYGISVNPTK